MNLTVTTKNRRNSLRGKVKGGFLKRASTIANVLLPVPVKTPEDWRRLSVEAARYR